MMYSDCWACAVTTARKRNRNARREFIALKTREQYLCAERDATQPATVRRGLHFAVRNHHLIFEPRLTRALPVAICTPSFGLKEVEVGRRIRTHGEMPDRVERVIELAGFHFRPIKRIADSEFIRILHELVLKE